MRPARLSNWKSPLRGFLWASSEVSSAFNLTALDSICSSVHCRLPTSYGLHPLLTCLSVQAPGFPSHRHRTWHGTQRGKRLGSKENGAPAFWSTQAIGQDWKGEAAKWEGLLRYNKNTPDSFVYHWTTTVSFWSSHRCQLTVCKQAEPPASNNIRKRGLLPHPYALYQRWAGG